MVKKLSIDKRKEKATEEFKKPIVDLNKIKKKLSECLKNKNIDGDIIEFDLSTEKCDYNKITKEITKNSKINDEKHIIWIKFLKSGHIALVGAGIDIGFSTNKNYGTWRFLDHLNNEWDKSKVIVIPVRGLDIKSTGYKNVKNILKCRNGVEHCIGKYLVDENVPILNYYQHNNYCDEFWEKCEKNNYNL
ncbi:hypothetical protein LW893_04210 [Parvimonas micra]|jgi:hypothetical protein|uniref:hypothetical protein n=1 Tax=Parvimonas micra TaxID=33033 RepID=UPI001E3AE915|nr:hypothetical protein [Parvimonas micra]MCE3020141.1 hypothetical protein [Parvimonas micra]